MRGRREEFALTPDEEPFEIGEATQSNDQLLSLDAAAIPQAQIDERKEGRDSEARWGGFWRRACAFTVDAAVIITLALIMSVLCYIGYKVGLSAHGRIVSLENAAPLIGLLKRGAIVLALVYFVLFHGLDGKTVGKWLFGLRVVGADRGTITYRRAILRSLGTIALAPGVFWILWSHEKRAWHDYLARTWVIRG